MKRDEKNEYVCIRDLFYGYHVMRSNIAECDYGCIFDYPGSCVDKRSLTSELMRALYA